MHMFVRVCVCVYLMVERRRNFNFFFIEISFLFHLWLGVRWNNQQVSVIYNYSFKRSHASEWSCNIYDLIETRNWTVTYKIRSQLSIFSFSSLWVFLLFSQIILFNVRLPSQFMNGSHIESLTYLSRNIEKTSIKIVNYDYIINLEQSAVEQTRQ